MTAGFTQSPVLAALAGALCVLGLVLLAPQPRPAARLALRVGFASAVWVGIWTLAMPLMGALIEKLPPSDFEPAGILAINLLPALGSWLPAALFVWVTRARGVSHNGFSALFALFWASGLILPRLGRDGSWAAQSLSLLACCAILAMILGVLSGTARTGAR